jgi:hypothetical protein
LKRWGAWLLASWWLGSWWLGGVARACPCSDEASSASGLVREDERYAVALVATSRRALGRFDALGQYRPLGDGEGEWSEELLLRAGLRLPRRLEWVGEVGSARYRLHAPGFIERQDGIGDALLRVRYSALDEAMPHEAVPLPAVSLSALLRAPLGAAASSGGTGSFGSGGAQRGLGAWELGAGAELKRSLLPALELGLSGEAAYRFEDHALGPARRLGPRLEAALGVRLLPVDWLASTIAIRLRTTGDVSLSGRALEGTSERLWSVVLGAAVYERGSRLRSSVTLSVDPPLGSLSKGATAATALGVSLAVGAP